MRCPLCHFAKSRVTDSRLVEESNSIRRRRECESCGYRFTTFEIIDELTPIVVKKDDSRELFDKNKVLTGLLKACEKRQIDAVKIADEIETEIKSSMRTEISSKRIGEMVMEKLKILDDVAYVRFASVHREFMDIDTFEKEISSLKKEKTENMKNQP